MGRSQQLPMPLLFPRLSFGLEVPSRGFPQFLKQASSVPRERMAAGHNYVQASSERFGIGDFEGHQLFPAQFVV